MIKSFVWLRFYSSEIFQNNCNNKCIDDIKFLKTIIKNFKNALKSYFSLK